MRRRIAATRAIPRTSTFDNTILALERSGKALQRVGSVFGVLAGATATTRCARSERGEFPAPRPATGTVFWLSGRSTAASKRSYQKRETLALNPEQTRRCSSATTCASTLGRGADADAAPAAEMNERAASLGTGRFPQNVLADESGYTLNA